MSNKGSILKSATAVTVVSILTLLFSFAKEALFAYYYGASSSTDAYAIAIQLPVTLFSLISTAISNVVLPYYSQKEINYGKQESSLYISKVSTAIVFASAALVVLCEIFAVQIIQFLTPGLSENTAYLAAFLFRIIVPTVILTELMNINTSVLNVNKSFVLPSLTSMVLNTTFVGIVVVMASSMGIYAAVCGTVVGTILEWLYSVLLRRKYLKLEFTTKILDDDVKNTLKKSLPVFIGIGAAEINKLVDELVASFLESGSITMIDYASKLTSAAGTLLIQGIVTVIYPELATSASDETGRKMADWITFSLRIVFILMVPIILGSFLLQTEIITIVFRRGAFSDELVSQTAPIFACYMLCLLFRAIRQILSRAFYSYGDTKTPMRNSFIGIIINIVLDFTLVKFLGAVGLALATTISTFVISILLMNNIKKKNSKISIKGIISVLGKVGIASIVMCVCVILMKMLAVRMGFYDLSSFISITIFTITVVAIGAAIYYFSLLVLKNNEIIEMTKGILKKK